ncbi:MAG: sigma-54-dependent transcriptional regulator [Myxococcota bacterium]
MATVWLVDVDEPVLAASLTAAGHVVSRHSVKSALSDTGPSADVALVRPNGQPPPLLARQLAAHAPATAWVMVLGEVTAQKAGAILDAGAADVCLEPLSPPTVEVQIARLVRAQKSRARLGHWEESAAREGQLTEVIGQSAPMRELLERVSRVSRRSAQGPPLSVMLTGETGTGKGLLARVLHYSSRRREGPFVELNCAALPATLLEAELFGHERGAFTDAKTARMGLLEAADGGTLFLDEVSYLPPEGQAKLLTVLETRRLRRLGSSVERQVDVQIVAASSHDLNQRVTQGQFKPELLHRLTALWFQLPPLRARGDDAVLLAERFLTRITQSYQLPPKRLSDEAREAIRTHAWPGNVRELYHALERAVLYEERAEVAASDLALHPQPLPAPAEELPPEGLAAIERAERALIERALAQEKGNVSRAAALLKVTRDVLRTRIEKYGL